jgi:hypothetical protein
MKNHFKMAIKVKNCSQKKLIDFCWEMERNKTNMFQLCCGQRAYVEYVGWKNLESLKITLKWLQDCQ